MQRKTPSRNIAARAGRWSAQHRKTAIFGWLAFVLIALVVGTGMGMKEVRDNSGPGESGRAGDAIERAFPKDDGASEQVLVQKKRAACPTLSSARAIDDGRDASSSDTQHVKDVTSPLDRGNPASSRPTGARRS